MWIELGKLSDFHQYPWLFVLALELRVMVVPLVVPPIVVVPIGKLHPPSQKVCVLAPASENVKEIENESATVLKNENGSDDGLDVADFDNVS